MFIITLKSYQFLCRLNCKIFEGNTHVYRMINSLKGYGLRTITNFLPLRDQIPCRIQNKIVLWTRIIPMHSYSWQNGPLNSCVSQRKPEVTYLCRVGSKSLNSMSKYIQYRDLMGRTRGNCFALALTTTNLYKPVFP